MQGIYFRVGARLLLRPEGMEPLSGVVRWVSGDLAGVEFDRSLYVPILDHIASAHAPETPQQRG